MLSAAGLCGPVNLLPLQSGANFPFVLPIQVDKIQSPPGFQVRSSQHGSGDFPPREKQTAWLQGLHASNSFTMQQLTVYGVCFANDTSFCKMCSSKRFMVHTGICVMFWQLVGTAEGTAEGTTPCFWPSGSSKRLSGVGDAWLVSAPCCMESSAAMCRRMRNNCCHPRNESVTSSMCCTACRCHC